MGKLIVIVGPSGVGKTTLARALAQAYPFQTAFEQHLERLFQSLFKQDKRYALANQIDYLLYRAEQERALRASPEVGLVDGGLDLDFHGFTRLFHARGWLTDLEFDLCRRLYELMRGTGREDPAPTFLPPPELVVVLSAAEGTVRQRLAQRDRINIASSEDARLMSQFVEEWLATLPAEMVLRRDVSEEGMDYARSVEAVLKRL
ncbi:MAG: deoxynucleoside kinase [Chloroflexota bacterium]